MVRLALVLPPTPDVRWQQSLQVGVNHAVVHPLEVGDGKTHWSYEELLHMSNWFEDAGLHVSVLEGSVPLTDRIRMGKPGRDEDIEVFKQFLRDCGHAGIPTVCYDWMAKVRWARTEAFTGSRGGSLVTGFTHEQMGREGESADADVTEDELWGALEYFLQAVVPVAEKAGVTLGLHPDDPPRPTVGGIPRIIRSPEAYHRVIEMVDSHANGITFCQGNFAAMGVDIPETVRRFAEHIKFVHFRDIEGDADNFVETWHDAGPTDMLAAMGAYQEYVDESVVMRPDHVPTMAGEDNSNPGYHMLGRLFAIGYMRGLLEQTIA